MKPPLPNFGVICTTDDRPVAGMPIMVTVKMTQQNDYHLVAGLTNTEGKLDISGRDLLREVEESLRLFPSDYAPLSGDAAAFAGELVVHPLTVPEIESALRAYELYHDITPYPPDYKQMLQAGLGHLLAQSPRRLNLTIDGIDGGQPVRISTLSVPFPARASSVPA
jgi:hypothetical protein